MMVTRQHAMFLNNQFSLANSISLCEGPQIELCFEKR